MNYMTIIHTKTLETNFINTVEIVLLWITDPSGHSIYHE